MGASVTPVAPAGASHLHPDQTFINGLAAKYDDPPAPTPDAVVAAPAVAEHPAVPTGEHPPAAKAADSPVEEDTTDSDDDTDADEEPEFTTQDDEDEEGDGDSFAAELTRMGVDASADLASITDPAARKVAEKVLQSKLRDFQAGFTQLRQQDRAAITELRTFQADAEFQQAHLPTIIAHRYQTDPAFADMVDAEITRLKAYPNAHEYVKRDLDAAHQTARDTVTERAKTEESNATALARIDVHVRQACEAVGLPQPKDKPVSKAIRLLVADAIDGGNGRLNKRQIDKIVGDYSREVRGVRRAETRNASEASNKAKLAAAARAPIVKPGSGNAPAPAAAAAPKNDKDFVAALAAKYS